MATGQTMAALPAERSAAGSLPGEGERPQAGERSQALVRAEISREEPEESPFDPLVLRLPVEMDVSVPVREFRVRHLLALEPGQVIESRWSHGNDLPLAAGEVRLAWTEFEVVDTKLSVRVTRVA